MKLMFYTLQHVESCRMSSVCELLVRYKRFRIEKVLILIGKNWYTFVALCIMLLCMIFYQLTTRHLIIEVIITLYSNLKIKLTTFIR